MKIQIIGDGSFGTFLKTLLKDDFEIVEECQEVILAIPISAYEEVAKQNAGKTLINVCSVQSEANEIISRHTNSYLGIHPLFGARSPAENRNSIVTKSVGFWPERFVHHFEKVSHIHYMSDVEHDKLMAKTHGASVELAKQAKEVLDKVGEIPDHLVPNSFKLLREFVKTLDDMPKGTLESILSNPYIEK